MKIEDLVLSIEQMSHLKELGAVLNPKTDWVKDTAFYYEMAVGEFSGKKDRPVLCRTDSFIVRCCSRADYVPTLTLQEILEMLPESIEVECRIPSLFKLLISKNNIYYSNAFNYVINDEYGKSMIDNAYNMLCWVAENGHLNKE